MLITIGVFVVLLACLPLARMLDASLDDDRPVFQDVLRRGFVWAVGQRK